MGDEVTLVNPAYETALELKELLCASHLERQEKEEQDGEKYQFFVSDAADKFKQFANSILPYDIETTRQIQIEEF